MKRHLVKQKRQAEMVTQVPVAKNSDDTISTRQPSILAQPKLMNIDLIVYGKAQFPDRLYETELLRELSYVN